MASSLAVRSVIVQAIERRTLLRCSFRGLARVVEPAVCGVRAGVETLQAIQIGGQTASGALPGWRNFNVSELTDVVRLDVPFEVKEHHVVDTSSWDHVFAKLQ